MSFTLKVSEKAEVDFEGTANAQFKLIIQQSPAGSLRLVSATYGGVTNNGPEVTFALVTGINPLTIVLAFAREGETGQLAEVDSAGQTQPLSGIVTRSSTNRTYFLEGA